MTMTRFVPFRSGLSDVGRVAEPIELDFPGICAAHG